MKSATRVETFELSAKPRASIPASTTKILWNYSRTSPPDVDDAVQEKRRIAKRSHAATVDQIRRWAQHHDRSRPGRLLNYVLPTKSVPKLPEDEALYSCIENFFPPRTEILVTVCDFGDGLSSRRQVRLGDIEKGMLITIFTRIYKMLFFNLLLIECRRI